MHLPILFLLTALSMLAVGLLGRTGITSVYFGAVERDVQSRISTQAALDEILHSFNLSGLAGSAVGEFYPSVAIGADIVEVSLEAEAGKISLGDAPPALLKAYIDTLGQAEPTFRGLDVDVSEARSTVAALISVPSVASDVSLVSRSSGVDLRVAPARVLAAIPDLDATERARIQSGTFLSQTELADMSAYHQSGGTTFSLVLKPENGARTYRAPIRITSSGKAVQIGAMY